MSTSEKLTEWGRTVIASIVGGLIAFGGTWYATNRVAEAEAQNQLRVKFEALTTAITDSYACFRKLTLSVEMDVECRVGTAMARAQVIQITYFPELDTSFNEYWSAEQTAISKLTSCVRTRIVDESYDQDLEDAQTALGLSKYDDVDSGVPDAKLTVEQRQLRKINVRTARVGAIMDCRAKVFESYDPPKALNKFLEAARNGESRLLLRE